MTDEKLLEDAAEGDETAFVALYQRHRDLVFRFAYRLLQSQETAEEITHDCFLSLIKNPRRFKADRGKASLRTYLCAAARNLAFKRFRRAGVETAIDDLSEQLAAAAVLLLCATSFLAARKATSFPIESAPAASATKFVQVPVPVTHEKIVTRVIRLKAEQGSPKPGSVASARDANNVAQSDLAGLRPVEEIKILVITEENKDEE